MKLVALTVNIALASTGNMTSSAGRAGTTRYWDCSGGSCGFKNPGDAITCPNSGCSFPWGEPKCSPHDWAPRWMSYQGESVLYAAAAASDLLYCGKGSGCTGWGDGSACGKCYLLTNPGSCSSGSPKLNKMIVRISNLCPGQYNSVCNNQNHFDISAPGFDYSGTSTSNVCTNGAASCDPTVYGSDACAYGSIDSCDCNKVSSDKQLVDGCNNFKMLGWDNCDVDFQEVSCPTNPSPPGPPPTPSPSGCTARDQDPWASGTHVPCCSGLNEVLNNWDGDGRYYYKCESGSGMNTTQQDLSAIAGTITMWSDKPALIGAECEYANAPATGLTDPMLASYIRDGMACAIGDSNPAFGKGEKCGQCFHISTSHGSATIMAVDHVDGNSHFDCIRNAWDKITGQAPGKLPMQFTQVPCDGVSGNPVIVNWADKNAYYCKMMFENVGGWGGVDGVHMCVDGKNCKDLTLFQGATWTGCPVGEGKSATFTLSQRGKKLTCNCQGSWPWDHGKRCTCASNFPKGSIVV